MFDSLVDPTIFLLLIPFLLGAVAEGGVLGKATGKVGNVVFSSWKGINTIRAYTVPSNPQTQSQQDNRTVFGKLAKIGSELNTSFLQEYWDGYGGAESPFNTFMRVNKDALGPNFSISDLELTNGGTNPIGLSDVKRGNTADELKIEGAPVDFPPTPGGSDYKTVVVVWNATDDQLVMGVVVDSYIEDGVQFAIPSSLDAGDIEVAVTYVPSDSTLPDSELHFYATESMTAIAADL